MYWYALIGVLAMGVLIIQNFEILFKRGGNKKFPEIEVYRRFLYGIMAYYTTDILWGYLKSLNLTGLLFLDTVVYYVAMAVGVLYWTQFVVTYLGEDNIFSRFLYQSGRFCFYAVLLFTILNCFTPVLFWFDEEGVYHACPARHLQLLFQIVLLLLTSIYTLLAIPKAEGASRNRYRTIFLFGLVVAVLLLIQLPYPFLPLYTIGYMLGSCLLHTFVVSNELDELMQRQSELAIAANKAKSAFLSNMSHEIRTPINSILGMNEMVLRESKDQNVLDYAENIKAAGNTLLGLVNDILDFSKIEAGKLEVIPVDYDLSSVINDLVNMVQTRADEKGLMLKLHFNPDIPNLLHGDEIRIKQIVTNILTNAVKYTEKGSVTFSIDFEPGPEGTDCILLKVSIADTGIGIKAEDMNKLFSQFDRIEEKRNRGIEGTGLGMSITKRLLEMMDSTLHVESVYGEGSVFSFCLSQEVVSWERLGDYEKSYRASLSQRRKAHASFFAPDAIVLVVDDNPMNLLVFKSLLKWTKVQVDMAESGDEGISLSLEKKYDLIFMDHMMPIKDGVEALHELRSQGNSPNLETPVICLTANAVSGAREQYIQAGFDDYLTKPIDSSKLEEMICYYLPEEKIKEAKEEEDPVHENGSEGEKPGTLQGCESGEIIDARPGHPAQAQSLEGGSERKGELSQEGEEENPDILKPLRGQDWIDLSLGIENSGSLEVYLSLLKIFYESLESKGEEIEKYWEEENWRDYTIQVHALKSSARLIGAMAFGEKAQLLENAGKEEDLDYIRANHREFMKEYEGFKKPLSQMFPASSQEGELLEPDPDRLRSSYERVRLAAEEMDIEELDKIISEMKKYRIPESERTLWHQLEEAVSHYDYDRITEIMSEV